MLTEFLVVLALSVLPIHAALPSKSSTNVAPDGGWHIGCNEPGRCSYYLEHAKRTALKASPGFIPGIEPYLKDHEGIDTRCSLTATDVVEKFNGSDWVHHYTCAPQNLCQNLMGSGSCAAGGSVYRVPTKNYLWSFFCPDLPNDEKTCEFLNTPPPDARSLPTPLDSISRAPLHFDRSANGAPPIRCDPEYSHWREVFNSTTMRWQVLEECLNGCFYVDGQATCFLAGTTHVQRSANEAPPTRCDPNHSHWREIFDSTTGRWQILDECLNGCQDLEGEATCILAGTTHVQSEDDDEDTDNEEDQEHDEPEWIVVTRCDPVGNNVVQYLHPSHQWISFYQCKKICKEFPEFTACEEQPGKLVAPRPPPLGSHKHPVRRESPSINRWTSKCDAPGQPGVTSYFDGVKVGKGNCPNNGVCLDSGVGVAVCKVDGRPYLMSQPTQQRRGDPYNPTAPDFHTFDTRCHPHNANEIQRHEAGRWVHHYQCLFKDSCRDVDGHGVCAIGPNLYILAAANASSVEQGEQKSLLRPQTSCNPTNTSEILEYTGNSWTHHGVCLPPTQCFDFGGKAGFALCAQTDTDSDERWLPWRTLSHSGNKGQVTRCKDERTLEEFKNNSWVPFQTCEFAFKCRHMEASLNGGCVADNVTQIMALGGVGVRKPAANDGPQSSPRREGVQHDLLSTSQELEAQGEFLVEEGMDLDSQSQILMETFWGDASDRLMENGARSANRADRAHRRGSDALIDDSLALHQEGLALVNQGLKLVLQGRALLKTILGNKTDKYIKNMVRQRAKTGPPAQNDYPRVMINEDGELVIIDTNNAQKDASQDELDSD